MLTKKQSQCQPQSPEPSSEQIWEASGATLWGLYNKRSRRRAFARQHTQSSRRPCTWARRRHRPTWSSTAATAPWTWRGPPRAPWRWTSRAGGSLPSSGRGRRTSGAPSGACAPSSRNLVGMANYHYREGWGDIGVWREGNGPRRNRLIAQRRRRGTRWMRSDCLAAVRRVSEVKSLGRVAGSSAATMAAGESSVEGELWRKGFGFLDFCVESFLGTPCCKHHPISAVRMATVFL